MNHAAGVLNGLSTFFHFFPYLTESADKNRKMYEPIQNTEMRATPAKNPIPLGPERFSSTNIVNRFPPMAWTTMATMGARVLLLTVPKADGKYLSIPDTTTSLDQVYWAKVAFDR